MGLVIICNALSLFKAQIICAILAITLKIPLIILFAKISIFGLTWELTILINMACYMPMVILGPIEIRKYLKKTYKTSFLESLKKKKRKIKQTQLNL